MSFNFKLPKNKYLPKQLKTIKAYKEKDLINLKNKSSFVPFLSNTEKLYEKIEETPGPGQYDIQNNSDNYIHKQYIKKNTANYKDSINKVFNIMNNLNFKFEDIRTPGPGEYNPGENNNFGAKAKKHNTFRNNFLIHQNELMMKNMISIKNLENEKSISMKNTKNAFNNSVQENMNNNTNINFCKTKKFDSTTNKIFKTLLSTYSKIKEDENNSHLRDQDSTYYKEQDFNSFNQSNNFSNTCSKLNLYTFNKSNSTTNVFNKNKKAKIYKTIHDHLRIKKLSEQKKLEMKIYSEKSNYYLEKYLSSKIFSQVPGPGYYFTKQPYASNGLNNIKNENEQKRLLLKLINNISIEKKEIDDMIEIKPENKKMKTISLSKTLSELKNDIIKKDFKKVKEIYIRNKYNDIMEKLYKTQQLQDKENKKKNLKKQNENNNNKEIQEAGYPIKYYKYISKTKKNNSSYFKSKEVRFNGPLGWANTILKNENPGPGHYEVDKKSISNKNQNIISLNLLKGYQIPKDRKLFTDEIKDNIPPVGSYQSQIFNSIEFNSMNKSLKVNDNPIKDGFHELIKLKTKKRVEDIKLNENISNSMVSPCSYFYNNKTTNNKSENIFYKSNSLRNMETKEYKLKEIKKKIKINDEPVDKGAVYKGWIKKTFNMSYV